MRNRFLSAIEKFGFSNPTQPILVAVSGGVDSMVLASLFYDCGFKIGVAHCNYQLRGVDSDKDEMLVRQWCEERNVPFHLATIDTEKLVTESNSSVQMIARNERYKFFSELMAQNSYAITAIAHHADDRIETLLMNVLRGTGLRGLQGMPSRREGIIRPLLAIRKSVIREYAIENEVRFAEDFSNSKTKYKRNWVRLKLIPMLDQINPHYSAQLLQFGIRVENELPNYHQWVESEMNVLLESDSLSIEHLKNSKVSFTLLKEVLAPKGFSSDQVFEVLELVDSMSGSLVQSETHQVLKNRERLLISLIEKSNPKPELQFETFEIENVQTLKVEKHVALFDAAKIDQPKLNLRNWKTADRFKPLGMKGWKKLSDFFIDEKIPVSEKDNIWLLTQENEIVWVIGMRPDDRFKVTGKTQKVLKVTVC